MSEETAPADDYKVVDDAINIDEIRDEGFQAGYRQKEEEVKVREEYHAHVLQNAIRKAYADGQSVVRNIVAQPYEIVSDVGIKYSAKGEPQPEASVKITRHLESDEEITDIIKADLARGVEEMMTAIEEIRKRNAGVRS